MVNFFFLSRDLKQCAQWHGDKHLHKMVTEYSQILSTAWHYSVHEQNCFLDPNCSCKIKLNVPQGVYRVAHRKHPTVLWAKKNIKHYEAILTLAMHLADERRRRNKLFVQKGDKPRFSSFHKSENTLKILNENRPQLPEHSWEDPPCAMPDVYKSMKLGVIETYRLYYAGHKIQVAGLNWYPANEPPWLKEYKGRITTEIQASIDEDLEKIAKKKARKLERARKTKKGIRHLKRGEKKKISNSKAKTKLAVKGKSKRRNLGIQTEIVEKKDEKNRDRKPRRSARLLAKRISG